jgi:hypothetical protein
MAIYLNNFIGRHWSATRQKPREFGKTDQGSLQDISKSSLTFHVVHVTINCAVQRFLGGDLAKTRSIDVTYPVDFAVFFFFFFFFKKKK